MIDIFAVLVIIFVMFIIIETFVRYKYNKSDSTTTDTYKRREKKKHKRRNKYTKYEEEEEEEQEEHTHKNKNKNKHKNKREKDEYKNNHKSKRDEYIHKRREKDEYTHKNKRQEKEDKKHKKRDYVYLDIATQNEFMGKIIIELFTDVTPYTCENFKKLCSNKNIRHSYQGSKFHRSIPGFMIQGGELEGGPYSIYGEKFPDENFKLTHDHEGLLSMANSGPDTNSSQFFITLNKTDHLDGKHVVFGKVIKGFDIVKRIAEIRTDPQDKPTTDVIIKKCGIYQSD